MKFHRVKLKNLNSLYGEQVVDFEEDIRSSPLFLIIGPTGAGKSTILDAICLALFGQTPRLVRKAGRSETDVAHVMSIGTASAYAEVEFSVRRPEGGRDRYLATWSTRRAYDDPEGAVQRPERSLYRVFPDASMRLVVADHREKYFQPAFEQALRGLTVDDFQRSILLAQGEFSAFLHASDAEKASILERLTSTDQYRVIGERAARKRREIDDRHRSLTARLEEMHLLTEPQARELADSIDAARDRVAEIEKRLESRRSRLQWLKLRAALEQELAELERAREAAEARRAERADDYERLRRDSELRVVEPAWREVRRLTRAVGSLDETRDKLTDEIEQLEREQKDAETSVEEAKTRLDAAQKARTDAEPALREALALRARQETARRETDAARNEAARCEAAKDELAKQHAEVDATLREAEAALAAASELRASLLTSRPLVDGLGAFRARRSEGIEPLERRAAALAEQLDTLKRERDAIVADIESFAESRGSATRERGTWQAQVTKAKNKLDELLDGKELQRLLEHLTRTNAAASTRAEALREARYLVERLGESERERDELYDRIARTAADVAALEDDAAALKELEQAHRKVVETCQEGIRQNERLIALSSYRRELHSGDPCPLCGSPIHPYCESDELEAVDEAAHSDRERLERELEEARDKVREVGERIQRQAAKFVARKTALQHDESRIVSLKMTIEEDQNAFRRAAQRAGYAPLEAFQLKDVARVDAELQEAERVAESSRATADEIDAARQQLSRAEAKLEAASDDVRQLEERVGALEEKARRLDGLIEARSNDLAATREERDARTKSLFDEIEDLGVDLPSDATLDVALDAAAERREALLRADAAHDEAAKAKSRRERERDRLAERLSDAEASLDRATRHRAAREAALAEIDERLVETLDGRDPDELREELEAQVASAVETLEARKLARATCHAKLSTARGRAEELESRRADTDGELKFAEAQLDEALEAIDIDRDALAEHLLEPSERERLRRELDALDEELARCTTRLEDARKRHDAHVAAESAEADASPSDESVEDAADAVRRVREELNQATLELGALRERWEKHEATKSRRVKLQDQLDDVQHELDVWNTIYGLIGVRDGERFKLFAQSLNLQGLVDRANYRLAQLHPRYRLTVARGEGGEPTLSFGVVDRYQANVERPLTTLSGGETFLVSLALALGLADFRRVDMPIETLLLDEGFGTLDQDSLHMALTTLHQLHQDADRQIGIISHVDALKELIDTRVVVEPVGHGRSQLRFEFGADYAQTRLALT